MIADILYLSYPASYQLFSTWYYVFSVEPMNISEFSEIFLMRARMRNKEVFSLKYVELIDDLLHSCLIIMGNVQIILSLLYE